MKSISAKQWTVLIAGFIAVQVVVQLFVFQFQRIISFYTQPKPLVSSTITSEASTSYGDNSEAMNNDKHILPATDSSKLPTLYQALTSIVNASRIDYTKALETLRSDYADDLKDEKIRKQLHRGFNELLSCQLSLKKNALEIFRAGHFVRDEAAQACMNRSGYFFHRPRLLSDQMIEAQAKLIQATLQKQNIKESFIKFEIESIDLKSEFLKKLLSN